MSKSTALAQLFEVLRGAVVAMNDRTTDYERGAVAARWLEFEVAPLLESIELENELARVEMTAIAAHGSKRGRMMLPIGSDIMIPPGQSAQFTARPQAMAFLPERILISPTIAPHFHIDDIRVGNRSQFLTYGGCDAMAFASDRAPADDLRLQFETCQTAMDLVFVVRYTGNNPDGISFRALILGITPESRTMGPPASAIRFGNGQMPKADAETLIAAWREIIATKPPTITPEHMAQIAGQAVSAANPGDDLEISDIGDFDIGDIGIGDDL